jgi:dipeptidyl aminopeptidase/acylaminoacyl peptidase
MLSKCISKTLPFLFMMVVPSLIFAQKKPLDHGVYDSWQSIGERKISANGLWLAYTIDAQEGDGKLIIQKTDSSYTLEIARGYQATFTEDGLYIAFKIKPLYADVRQAKIKKKKPEEFPKDSLGIYDLTLLSLEKIPGVLSFKLPENSSKWLAYQLNNKNVDSVKREAKKDSFKTVPDTGKAKIPLIIEQTPDKKQKRKMSAKSENDPEEDAEGDEGAKAPVQEGSELVVRNLSEKKETKISLINEYYWSENGKILLLESSASKTDKSIQPMVYIWRSVENRFDTIMKGGNDFKNFTIDKAGYQIAFVAERDSSFKSLQKFYKLWLWQNGDKEASVIADKYTVGMNINWTVNEYYTPSFSEKGKRLFLGTNPIKSIKDTSLIEMDLAKVDIWHYNDDYLQPYQLRTAEQESKRAYLGMIDLSTKKFTQLADLQIPQVVISNEGDGEQFLGMTDRGKRVSMQWEGGTRKDIYSIEPATATKTLVKKELDGMAQISPLGKYIYWYDSKARQYFSYHNGVINAMSKQINQKMYDEEYDMPSDPTPYGQMKWEENDASLFVYDRYDIWQVDPLGKKLPLNITAGVGRKTKTSYRFISTNPDEKSIQPKQVILLKTFNEVNKFAGLATMQLGDSKSLKQLQQGAFAMGFPLKAKKADAYIYTKETYTASPNVFFSKNLSSDIKLSSTNPQQAQYNWGTAELFTWKAYNGKTAMGIVYKPENFEEGKKYPMISYFYETLSDGLYSYLPPAPTPSRLNISFFVSRGYIVLAPDIHYVNGYPGKGGFDYVVSGSRALVKKGWVDSTKMGIQGQSWGGYQVAHIITRTNLFAAAWAGAPVANMTSAYGGIRWESGMNRQFQYEKTQSRIGATLWEKPNLYIENSPLFHLPKVKTPLVIMSNDADGAVPWYQGIEMFTAMRRLNKKVWLLNYNGEAHNLVERRNRKDIQIREQQFFDWLLKGEKPTVWLTEGVPAVEKGKSWGLE